MHSIGVEVETPVGVMVARAMLLLGSMDVPARAIVTNMKHFNGKFSCLYCHHSGETEPGNHLHRYWPNSSATMDLTTVDSMLADAESAITQGEAVSCLLCNH